jgi:hypothetical protein
MDVAAPDTHADWLRRIRGLAFLAALLIVEGLWIGTLIFILGWPLGWF